MILIGINAYHADASAAIFVDGKMIAAIEEERFTRVKHWSGFPVKAIEFCLKEAGIGIEQVDYFCIGRDPKAKFLKKVLFLLSHPFVSFPAIKERFSNSKKVSSIDAILSEHFALPQEHFKGKIKNVEHHISHISSAFFASPFQFSICFCYFLFCLFRKVFSLKFLAVIAF
jgi:carbamoyltransferase